MVQRLKVLERKRGILTRESWEGLTGSTVCGKYLLRELLGSTDESAVFLGLRGDETVAVKLVPADGYVNGTPKVEHPNLIRLIESGPMTSGGMAMRYIITEAAD